MDDEGLVLPAEMSDEDVELPSDDEGLVLSAEMSDEDVELPSDDEGPMLPSDDDGVCDQAEPEAAPPMKSKKRRRHQYIPGPTRADLIEKICMLPAKNESLWFAVPPEHMLGAPQDDVMEVYSPCRVVGECRKQWGLRGDISADLVTGWNFSMHEHRLSELGSMDQM